MNQLVKFTLCAVALFYTTLLLSQNPTSRLFELANENYHRDAVLKKGILLKLNQEELKKIWNERPDNLQIDLPVPGSKPLQLTLETNDIFTEDFKVTLADQSNTPYEAQKGLHFKGKVNGKAKSLAAVSLFRNKVMGVLAQEDGNYVLGQLDEDSKSADKTLYIFYKEEDLEHKLPIECHTTDEHEVPSTGEKNHKEKSLTSAGGTVRVYFECDYAMYLEKGSNVNAVNDYVTGLFNAVATLYNNESITTQISEIKVWTSQDPYPTNASDAALDVFGERMKTNGFNGDLAHLLSRNNNNLGGIAWIDVLCNRNYSFAYSNISSTFNAYPTYSWTVTVVTHEMGHNLGSQHTHWCGWQGGPIDNCACVDSGPCTTGPEPAADGGTIMSYCHLRTTSCSSSNPGVNYSYGFGPQPGNKIRAEVMGATCLTTTPTCLTPTSAQFSATNITINAAQLQSSLTTVSQFDWQYRVNGTSTWTDVAQSSNNFVNITDLNSNTTYEFQLKVLCTNGVWSAWSASKIFTTTSNTICNAPTAAQTSVANVTTNAAQLQCTLTGVSQYDWQYRVNGTSTWTDVAQGSANVANISGLNAGTLYEFQVKVLCTNGIWSDWSAAKTFTTGAAPTCTAPTVSQLSATNITFNSAQLQSSLTGVSQYDWQYRVNGTTTWTDVAQGSANSVNINGLNANTTYEFQVKVQCTNGVWSAWSASQTFTTPQSNICNAPTTSEIDAANVTTTTAQLQCNISASRYDFRYRRQGTTLWTEPIDGTANFYNATRLSANKTYEFQVSVQCSNGIWSSWSTSKTFFTSNSSNTSCDAPTTAQISASGVTSNAAQLESSVTGVSQYDWQYRTGGGAWTSVPESTVSFYTITGLNANTTYEFQARMQCTNGIWSAWSSTKTFTTTGGGAATCAAPTAAQLSASSISTTSAQLNCSLNGVSQYEWQYRAQGASSWTNGGTTTNGNVSLTGLNASTTYEFQVKVQCSNGVTSAWSASQTFATTGGGTAVCARPASANMNVTNITGTSARLNYTISGFSNYEWRYKRNTVFSWTAGEQTTTNYYDLTGLSRATNYDYQVRVFCNGDWTSWSPTKTFRTAASGIIAGSNWNESDTDLNIKTYPTPANDYLSVEFRLNERSEVQIALRDLTGRTVQTISVGTLPEGNHTERLQLENAHNGIYLLEITSRQRSQVVKVLIQ